MEHIRQNFCQARSFPLARPTRSRLPCRSLLVPVLTALTFMGRQPTSPCAAACPRPRLPRLYRNLSVLP